CASFSRSFATVHHVIGGQNRCGSSAVPNVVSVDASEELADSVRRRTRMVVAWWSIIPFVLLLGCIAVLPLIPATEKIWDRFLVGDIKATPRTNSIFLAVGGALASFIGTTGAAMLLIRPILNTNQDREHRTHTVIYTIFIVANCGGLLTPLGDPPLFLGMLRG